MTTKSKTQAKPASNTAAADPAPTPIIHAPAQPRRVAASGKPTHVSPAPQVQATKPARVSKASAPVAPPAAAKQHMSKQAILIDLLRSADGTTIALMMAATGWQAHSVRGVISGTLRKKLGLNVISEATAVGSVRTYRILA